MRGRYRVGAVPDGLAFTQTHRRPVLALTMFTALAGLVMYRWWDHGAAGIYGAAVFAILGGKLLLSLLPTRPLRRADPSTRVGVVVTVYNEDPALLTRCLDSLLAQTFAPARVVVVDDHSSDLAAFQAAQALAARDSRIIVHRQPTNAGKREALAVGFRQMAGEVDVFVCVDSDSVLEPTAIAEGLRPFRSHRVTAATGLVLPLNHDRNLLTRLQDVRYANAFLGERAAYSRLGSVLCVCGILAFYRADVVARHLDDFLTQTFLGKPAVTGDDRRLTNYALSEGRVVFVESAVGHTAVPEKMSHFTRQQARWGRSFWRESLWVLRSLTLARAAWWLTAVELAQWAVFSSLLLYVVAIHPAVTGEWLVGEYLLMVGCMAVARSVRYLDVERSGQTWRSRLLTFATAPLYGYLSLAVMLPLRLWSLLTLRRTRWGTRGAVEVTATQALAVAR